MRTLFLIVAVCATAFATQNVKAQSQTSRQKTQQLAAVFSKTKDKFKDRDGAVTAVRLRVSSEPWIADEASLYAGTYVVTGTSFRIQIVAVKGGLQMTGQEQTPGSKGLPVPVRFTNVRVADGWLTATRIKAGKQGEPFEAAFLKQSRNGEVVPGIGVKLARPFEMDGLALEKLFYARAL